MKNFIKFSPVTGRSFILGVLALLLAMIFVGQPFHYSVADSFNIQTKMQKAHLTAMKDSFARQNEPATPTPATTTQQTQQLERQQELLAAYEKRDVKAINSLQLTITETAGATGANEGTLAGTDVTLRRYLVTHHLAENPEISGFKAFNQLAGLFGLSGTQLASTNTRLNFIFYLSGVAALLIALALTKKRRHQWDALENTLPKARAKLLATDCLVVWLELIGVYLVALIAFVLIIGLMPGFGFGALNYPEMVVLHEKSVLLTLGQFILAYSGLIVIWLAVLTVMGYFVARFTASALVVAAVLIIFTWMPQLGLFSLLAPIQNALPLHYLYFADVLLQRGAFSKMTLAQPLLVLSCWLALFASLSGLVIFHRQKI